MRRLPKSILAIFLLALASCSNNNDNAHTTATTVVPPRAVVRCDKLGYLHMEVAPVAQKRERLWAEAV